MSNLLYWIVAFVLSFAGETPANNRHMVNITNNPYAAVHQISVDNVDRVWSATWDESGDVQIVTFYDVASAYGVCFQYRDDSAYRLMYHTLDYRCYFYDGSAWVFGEW